MSDNQNLPEDWTLASVGDLVALSSGDFIKAGDYKGTIGEVIVVGAGGRLGQTTLSANTGVPAVVIGRVGAAGSTHYFEEAVFATDNTLIATAEPRLRQRYLYHFLRSVDWSPLQSGSSQPLINQRTVKTLRIPIPPVETQDSIADVIDTVDAARSSASHHTMNARSAIDRFRQAVLAAACSGRLTADWGQVPESDGKPNDDWMPDGWRMRSGNEVFTFVTSGSRGWAKYYADTGPAFIRVGNLDHDSLDLDLSDVQRVAPPDNAEARRTSVQPGDLLVSITADIGMVAVAPKDLGPAHVNQHVAIARPDASINPRYIACFIASLTGGQAQLGVLERGATRSGLGLDDIRSLSIPIPPRNEQDEIVGRIDRLLRHADKIAMRIETARHNVDRSSQAVLAKAFRGELVISPQEAS